MSYKLLQVNKCKKRTVGHPRMYGIRGGGAEWPLLADSRRSLPAVSRRVRRPTQSKVSGDLKLQDGEETEEIRRGQVGSAPATDKHHWSALTPSPIGARPAREHPQTGPFSRCLHC